MTAPGTSLAAADAVGVPSGDLSESVGIAEGVLLGVWDAGCAEPQPVTSAAAMTIGGMRRIIHSPTPPFRGVLRKCRSHVLECAAAIARAGESAHHPPRQLSHMTHFEEDRTVSIDLAGSPDRVEHA